MTTFVRFERHVVVAAPAVTVFEYAADFTRAKEWRTEVIESTMSTPKMAEGTVLREVAVIFGRKIVTLSRIAEFDAGHRFTFEHVEGMLPVRGEYRVEPKAGGTELTYVLEVQLAGLWALAAPYLRRAGRKMITNSFANFRERLEQQTRVD